MKCYLVGGAVRDQLLNIDVHDKDWVVVGSSPEAMQAKGFRPVGSDFPVFLHPNTQEEYALARTERKNGLGYTGFDCFFSPDVTLEEDLARRDLTINAIAQDEQGNLIDPYQGQIDLKNRCLRHVSPAFSEDPLRVLRVARFAAKLGHLGFRVANETMKLMQGMVQQDELAHLTAERVWQEWYKSLNSQQPQQFLDVLHQCGALKAILPEIDALFGVPQTAKWHPEIDTGIHTLMVAEQAARISNSPTVRFAAQLHDLGKALTPVSEWPSHKMHEIRGIKPVKTLCKRLKVPSAYRDIALHVCEFHLQIHNISKLKPATVLKLFNLCDAWRKPERFQEILLCCKADLLGRKGCEETPYPQLSIATKYLEAATQVDVQNIIAKGAVGAKIKEQLDYERKAAIKAIKIQLDQVNRNL